MCIIECHSLHLVRITNNIRAALSRVVCVVMALVFSLSINPSLLKCFPASTSNRTCRLTIIIVSYLGMSDSQSWMVCCHSLSNSSVEGGICGCIRISRLGMEVSEGIQKFSIPSISILSYRGSKILYLQFPSGRYLMFLFLPYIKCVYQSLQF